MDAQRTGEPLDLERELAAALAVEPSVEFLARVRMRIAAEPDPPVWRSAWMLPAAGVCVVLVVLAGIMTYAPPPPFAASRARIIADISLLVPALIPAPLAVAASGSRREEPTPEMRGVMQSNAETNRTAQGHLEAGDYEGLVADATAFSRNFAYIESFWAARRVDGAVRLSRRGLEAAAGLRAAALARDNAAVASSIAALTAVCGGCHLRHRELLSDDTYTIKL